MTESVQGITGFANTNESNESDGWDDQTSWLIRYGAPCPAESVEVRRLSDHEWRIGDSRHPEHSPEKVLGYIEMCGAFYEVLSVRAPHERVFCVSFESAVASFTTRSSAELRP